MFEMYLFRKWTLTIAFGSICAVAGCAEEGPVCYPVRGQVSFQGKPAADAEIVLHRVGGDVEGNQKPIANVGPDGRFAISTMRSGDGAPPGEYAITIVLRMPQMIGEEMVRNGPNQLPPKYAKPDTSGLRVTVVEGDNEIPPIELN